MNPFERYVYVRIPKDSDGVNEKLNEFAQRLLVMLAVICLTLIQLVIASKVFTPEEADVLLELVEFMGYTFSAWDFVAYPITIWACIPGVQMNMGIIYCVLYGDTDE